MHLPHILPRTRQRQVSVDLSVSEKRQNNDTNARKALKKCLDAENSLQYYKDKNKNHARKAAKRKGVRKELEKFTPRNAQVAFNNLQTKRSVERFRQAQDEFENTLQYLTTNGEHIAPFFVKDLPETSDITTPDRDYAYYRLHRQFD